jgi:hypothetical protein
MMKKVLLLIILLSTFTFTIEAQSWKQTRFEVFSGAIAFQYFGDIGGSSSNSMLGIKDMNLFKTRPGLSIGVRYQITKPIQVKTTYTTGFISQSDVGSRNAQRDYAFTTFINEVIVMGEYYLIPEGDNNNIYPIMALRGGIKHFRQPFSIYLTLGAGGVYYSVKPNAKLAADSRFSTGTNYAAVIPMGGGIKYSFLPKISLGVEIIGRITTTNYLDGLSPQKSSFDDMYHSIMFKLAYKIQTEKNTMGPPKQKSFF